MGRGRDRDIRTALPHTNIARKSRGREQSHCYAQTALLRANRTAAKNRTVAHKPRRRAQTVSLRANCAAAGIFVRLRFGNSWCAVGGAAVGGRCELSHCRAQIALLRTNRAATNNYTVTTNTPLWANCTAAGIFVRLRSGTGCCAAGRQSVEGVGRRDGGDIPTAPLRANHAVAYKPRRRAQTALPRTNRAVAHKPRRRAQTVSLRANCAAAGIFVRLRFGNSWCAVGGAAVGGRCELLHCRAQIALLRTNRTAEYIARLGFNRAAGASVASGRSPVRGA